MAKRKSKIDQAEIVRLFGAKLREARVARGLTQVELAHKAELTAAHLWRLESGSSAPGIDLVERLAKALGEPLSRLLPDERVVDTEEVFRARAKELFGLVLELGDRETFAVLNPLLACLAESAKKRG